MGSGQVLGSLKDSGLGVSRQPKSGIANCPAEISQAEAQGGRSVVMIIVRAHLGISGTKTCGGQPSPYHSPSRPFIDRVFDSYQLQHPLANVIDGKCPSSQSDGGSRLLPVLRDSSFHSKLPYDYVVAKSFYEYSMQAPRRRQPFHGSHG
ncbi:hypothetical protein N657DRAFT_65384 [Parathielavia appendiculata]|uniref:Uncharacterized protein n=1 Tax=Parathielavia appendiculata TaxID=2587402 RepID=A0AAN6UAK7_9PEZI|nr:hypothetical protein N657DRAFT_65384 [Parathielavia appendiculata]